MHRWCARGIQHPAPLHLGVEQPVVAALHPLLHRAVEPGQGLRQDRLPLRGGFQLQAGKAIGARGKGLQELLHRPAFPAGGQHVERKVVADVQQRFHGPVLGHGHGDPRRRKAGLTHPAGHHGAGEPRLGLAFAGGEQADRPHHPAQGLERWVAAALIEAASGVAALLFALLVQEGAAQAGAGFFDGFEGGRVGAEFHLDRFKGKAEAAIAQLAFEQIECFTAPAEAAKHPHRFAAIPFGQQGAQG